MGRITIYISREKNKHWKKNYLQREFICLNLVIRGCYNRENIFSLNVCVSQPETEK